MKKQLLATTALVGASLLVTGNAWAQASPITMGVKGYWRMFVQWVDAPDSDNRVLAPFNPAANGVTTYTGSTGTANTRGHLRSWEHDIESRTFFVGEGKLDNGITPGVNIQFETFNRNGGLPAGGSAQGTNAANGFFGNQERRARGYFKSAWGEVGMGNVDNIERLNGVYEAIANLLGTDSPSGVYPLGTVSTYNDPASAATRLYYMSPKFAGFDFGVSYAPDNQSDVRSNGGGGGNFTQDGIGNNRYAGAMSQNYTLMGRYIGQIGAFGLGADYGYTGSSNECSGRTTAAVANFSAGCVGFDKNQFMHTARGYVTYAGFRLGMSYQILKNAVGNNLDRETFAPGIDYTTGPWTFGVYYGHGNYDGLRAPLSGTGAALGSAVTSTDKLDMISPSVVYLLGPGVRLEASYTYEKYKYGNNASYRNASDFGFSRPGDQSANVVIFGATFAY